MKYKATLLNKVTGNVLATGVYTETKFKLNDTDAIVTSDKKLIQQVLERKKFSGKAGSATVVSTNGSYSTVVVVGLGPKKLISPEIFRKAGAVIQKTLASEGLSEVVVDTDGLGLKEVYEAQAFCEGSLLASYQYTKHKSEPAEKKQDIHFNFACSNIASVNTVQKSFDTAKKIADAVFVARDFANEPPNFLYPESYAEQIKTLFQNTKVKCDVFNVKKLESLKMGGILAVGKGSARGPRLVILDYAPGKSASQKPVVLVGKGVTFDTGGISLKPGKSMDEMKFDMCGSAAVVGAIKAISDLKLPTRVVGLLPLAENMPDGIAQRPGDVITCFNGKTVEVYNTDAEGRLILADALAFSEKYKPRYVVDIATLTGACASTLDYVASGVMGNTDELIQRLRGVGDLTGERLWEFPLWEEYDEFIRGSYGDIRNISRRSAGIQTAGVFLKNFGNHSPWAHIDIAGTAWGEARHYTVEGATGVGVRLFVEFIRGL